MNIGGRDIVVFLMSLFLAFSIWLIYNLSLNYSATMSVAVVAECNLDGHSNISSNSCTVAARCRTTGYNLLRNRHQAKRDAIHVKFSEKDMTHREGDLFSISSAELASYIGELFGDGVRLESFLSETVLFRFPFENNKRVPVQENLVATYRTQYMAMGGMRLSPDSVTIYGEPFHLDKIDRVFTKAIDLQNLHSSAHGVVKLEPLAGIRMSDSEVNYSLDVTRYVEIQSEVSVPMRNVPSGRKVSVYPSVAKVTYKCVFPLSGNPEGDVRFYIDYKDFENSIGGKCVAKATGLSSGVIEYRLDPEVFDCVEVGKQ
jgi:YbbR-like protein.